MKINGLEVPDAIVQAYQDYGFAKQIETAIATRADDDCYAILFKDRGNLYTVVFEFDGGSWYVLDDYCGPFESIEDFQSASEISPLR